MKKILLSLTLVLFSFMGFAQNVLSLFSTSTEFFEALENKDFQAAQNLFDETVKPQVSLENLERFWNTMKLNLGNIESLEPVKSESQNDLVIVLMDGSFEKGKQNFNLVFNKAGKMVGFFLQQSSQEQVYVKPDYANEEELNAQDLYLKTDNRQLAAVLTTPKGKSNFPIVILVHGSGPQDMDETIGPNKPFKDLAYGLAKQGIATLRYVKRTMIYRQEFTGIFTVKEEVLDDVQAAIALAKQTEGVDPKRIYVFGHSLGGMLAPRIASMNPDVKGIILGAAPARSLTDLLVEQNHYAFSKLKDTTAQMKQQLNLAIEALNKTRITKLGNMKADSLVMGLPASYWIDLNNYNAVQTAKSLRNTPILVMQGGNDFQVSKTDYDLWQAGLKNSKIAVFKFYPNLNHLFSVQSEKGTISQYNNAANVDEAFIKDISSFIQP